MMLVGLYICRPLITFELIDCWWNPVTGIRSGSTKLDFLKIWTVSCINWFQNLISSNPQKTASYIWICVKYLFLICNSWRKFKKNMLFWHYFDIFNQSTFDLSICNILKLQKVRQILFKILKLKQAFKSYNF